jgi:hypothetical protein
MGLAGHAGSAAWALNDNPLLMTSANKQGQNWRTKVLLLNKVFTATPSGHG